MIVSSGNAAEPSLALTFDDGPDERYSPALLEVLAEHSARATFFIRGSAITEATREILTRADAAGHELANHTHGHFNLEGADRSFIREEIVLTHDALEEITGRPPALIRPPFGRAPQAVDAVAQDLGYRATVLWNSWGVDWENPPKPAETLVERVLDGYLGLAPIAQGGIVLLHDGSPDNSESRAQTVEATRLLIPALHAMGLQLVTVSELLG